MKTHKHRYKLNATYLYLNLGAFLFTCRTCGEFCVRLRSEMWK